MAADDDELCASYSTSNVANRYVARRAEAVATARPSVETVGLKRVEAGASGVVEVLSETQCEP